MLKFILEVDYTPFLFSNSELLYSLFSLCLEIVLALKAQCTKTTKKMRSR